MQAFQPRQRIVYDGKRMRKSMTRRTVDYTSTLVRLFESPIDPVLNQRTPLSMQPSPHHLINEMPTFALSKDPMDAICSKFVHLSQNKARCPINQAKWSPDGRRVMTGASTGEITLWNGSTFNFETILQAHDSAIRAMTWSHNGNFMISGDHGGTVKVWQPSMNNLINMTAHSEPVRALTFASSDLKFASSSDDGAIKVWDFVEAKEERTLSGHGWDVRCVDWHPRSAIIASGSKDSLLKLWDPRTGTTIHTLYGHKNSILDVRWNQINGHWLASTAKDQLIKLFDIRQLKGEFASFRGHTKEINNVHWHPFHETLFATASGDGSIRFWLTTQPDKEVASLIGAHESIVWSVDWHPLGHILASASADGTTRFWIRQRPGDTCKDKYVLGLQAAEALGISTADHAQESEEEDEEQEQQQLPGLGKRPFATRDRYGSDRSQQHVNPRFEGGLPTSQGGNINRQDGRSDRWQPLKSNMPNRYDNRYSSPQTHMSSNLPPLPSGMPPLPPNFHNLQQQSGNVPPFPSQSNPNVRSGSSNYQDNPQDDSYHRNQRRRY